MVYVKFVKFSLRFGRPLFLIFSDDPEWCKMHFLDRDILIAGEFNKKMRFYILFPKKYNNNLQPTTSRYAEEFI